MEKLTFVFVHGLSGWGSYDARYRKIPYWGMRGGDLIGYLRDKGYDCYAASVGPASSAWDRACELYAQIAGKRVDYGKAHSTKFRHARYGKDFSACPLIPSFDECTRLVLLGHSFGGATVRLFSELLAHGDAEEQASGSGDEISPLFLGGMENRISAVVTLASPMNGTTAYDLFEDPAFDPSKVRVPFWSRIYARMMSLGTAPKKDGRDIRDYAGYDMHIDNAAALNRRMRPLPGVCYISVPCCYTKADEKNDQRPQKGMEKLFWMRSCQIGAYTGKTHGGIVIDSAWKENDGLVNTNSAACPIGDEQVTFDREALRKGVWNVYPTVRGDHMYLQGGLVKKHEIRPFYTDLLEAIHAYHSKNDYQ